MVRARVSNCLLVCVVVCLPPTLTGCGHPRKPTFTLSPVTVPVMVYQVITLGDNPNGGVSNTGCRLTKLEIEEYMLRLQLNAHSLYGAPIVFDWSPSQLREVVHNELYFRDGRTSSLAEEFYPEVVMWHWEAQYINIYFVADVQIPPYSTPALGLCVDPAEAWSFFPPFASIIINDGGFDQDYVYETHWDDYVLEHEMTHFLARFRNQTVNGTYYDDDEHAPPEEWNILAGGGVTPLVLPGRPVEPTTERGRIWTRVSDGKWLDP